MPEPESSKPRAAKRRKMTLPSNTSDSASVDSVGVAGATVASAPTIPDENSHSTEPGHETEPSRISASVQVIEDSEASESDKETDLSSLTVSIIPSDDLAGPRRHTTGEGELIWPADRVPVEIFNMIIEHLPRKDIQNMRLVNHEFDAKLAEFYFKAVVVPFRPEFEALYGSLNINPGRIGEQQKLSLVFNKKRNEEVISEKYGYQTHSSVAGDDESLLSDGYRVFEQFGGSCMRKFALALELNEKDLAFPPLKLNQEIVMAPWGLYRWPIMNYQRYRQLEGLEQMADETGYMKMAFQHLRSITDIGISCDAGLGWLHGPDTNPFCTRTRPAVFRPVAYEAAGDGDDIGSDEEENGSLSLSILKQMAMNAGYSSTEWPRAILRLLEDEGRAIEWREVVSPEGKTTHERVPTLEVNDDTSKEEIIQHIEALIDEDGADVSVTNTRSMGLMPNNLTNAQAEMLLELEWAHRALMQSYRIAVLDNRDSFLRLTQLTIARCPSCHVATWCDDSFWETMTSIKSFHLGVIPDWREITKDTTGAVNQSRVVPTDAVQNVFKLLQHYVGYQENIKHVSFEWVCGGEFAVGKSQRDRYILPAPVFIEAGKMVDLQSAFTVDDVLNLPYASKLSLKNCWFTPHVFLNFFKSMFMEDLEQVVLESVSLTGPPSLTPELSIYPSAQKPTHWPWPLCVGAEPGNWFQLQRPNAINNMNQGLLPWMAGAGLAQANPPPPQNILNANVANMALNLNAAGWGAHQFAQHQHTPIAVNQPTAPTQQAIQNQHANEWRAWSWPHILARLNMSSENVSEYLKCSGENAIAHWHNIKSGERQFSSKFNGLLEDRENKKLCQVMKFKSCGYALIESPNIDNWKIIPDQALRVDHDPSLPNRLKELDNQMLISQEGLLAKVLNHMPDEEDRLLQMVFGLEFGWDGIYDTNVSEAAIADGNPHPGQARFHGDLTNKPNNKDANLKFKARLAGR